MDRIAPTRRPTPPALLLALALAAGCADDPGPTAPAVEPPIATSLSLDRREIRVLSGDTTRVLALVLDQRGAPMQGTAATWTSRDPSTALVTADGLLTGRGGGDAWVVAEAAGFRDSVMVQVRYRVGPGEAHLRMRHDGGDMSLGALTPEAFYGDLLGTEARDRTRIDVGWSNGGITLVLPRPAALPGRTELKPLAPGDLTLETTIFGMDAGVGFAYLEEEEDEVVLFLGSSGYLETVEAGPERLAGHAQFVAVGYAAHLSDDFDLVLTANGDTLLTVVDFDAAVDRASIPWAEVTLTGGPLPLERALRDARVAWPPTNQPSPVLIDLQVRGGPSISTLILDPRPGARVIGAGSGASVDLRSWYPYFHGWGTSGTLTLEDVATPIGQTPGELHGRLQSSILYQLDEAGERLTSGTLQMEFHAHWPPREGTGVPSSAPAEVGRAWSPLLGRVVGLTPP